MQPITSFGSSCVVYFDQCLDAAHSKGWSKYAFSRFCMKNIKKEPKGTKKEKWSKMGLCLANSNKLWLYTFGEWNPLVSLYVLQKLFPFVLSFLLVQFLWYWTSAVLCVCEHSGSGRFLLTAHIFTAFTALLIMHTTTEAPTHTHLDYH